MAELIIPGRIPLEYGHTCLNYFILLDCRGRKDFSVTDFLPLAQIFCATPMADDLLVLQDSEVADVRLRILGGDGREADFCGNGTIYTSAKMGREKSKSGHGDESDRVRVETASGIKEAVRLDGEWRVEIGPALMLRQELARVPASLLADKAVLGLVRAGEPHLVLKASPIMEEFHMHRKEFEDYCQPLRDVTNIEGGVSITIVFESKDKRALIRTFERGVRRQTFSCGTGSISAAAALFDHSSDHAVFDICSPGGRHKVIYEQDKWHLVATPQPIGEGYLENSVMHFSLSNLCPYMA